MYQLCSTSLRHSHGLSDPFTTYLYHITVTSGMYTCNELHTAPFISHFVPCESAMIREFASVFCLCLRANQQVMRDGFDFSPACMRNQPTTTAA